MTVNWVFTDPFRHVKVWDVCILIGICAPRPSDG